MKNNNPFNIPDLDPMLKAVSNFVKENQGEKGFINTHTDEGDILYGYRYNGNELKEYRIMAVAFMDNELCILLDDEPLEDYSDKAVEERLDQFESVRYSDVMYVQTIFNIAEIIEEYA